MSDFKGFRFGSIHIKDLHLTVVSSGDRFNKNLLPDPTDYSVDVPGGNGKYYFGQTHSTRSFSIKTAFDNLDEATIRRIRQIFVTDKLKDLVFDEEPYKTYRAKLSRAPSFNYVCFLDKETNQRVYKGECDFDFILYHPYAFCFNKYIVTAADCYECTPPELIIKPSEDTYAINNNPVPPVNKTIKSHYNIINNMQTSWKGGYPTIEQAQNGELYYKNGNIKTILDVKKYWDNIPRWQIAAKLLTTPTLDYDQELIYMPQYSSSQYYNMDMGASAKNSAIGSRLLVYNPGDISIDFKLNLGNLSNEFRGEIDYTFRISRYNVQRLTIEQAVDWTGLRTFEIEDNNKYKYDNKYFKTFIPATSIPHQLSDISQQDIDYKDLSNSSHPRHCYIVEPIPKDKLGYFIRLFYKQTNLIFNRNINNDNTKSSQNNHYLNHYQGEQYAEEYEEKLEACITEEESNELYWTTLKKAILDRYKDYNNKLAPYVKENKVTKDSLIQVLDNCEGEETSYYDNDDKQTKEGILIIYQNEPYLKIFNEDIDTYVYYYAKTYKIFNDNYTYNDFVYDFIYNPSDYIRETEDLNYGEFNFNLCRLPQFYTFDYLDISNENFNKILWKNCGCDEKNNGTSRTTIKTLTLDSESRLLYNIKEEEWNPNSELLEKNFYKIDKEKINFNDNIKKGHWFQLPPGWSLIDISPIVNENQWGGKRWLDARPFKWGIPGGGEKQKGQETRDNFNRIYADAIIKFINRYYPERRISWPEPSTELYKYDECIQFRRWYQDLKDNELPESYAEKLYIQGKYKEFLSYSINKNRTEIAERRFLQTMNDCFVNNGVDIDQWWWDSNNYIWINFPPIYWSFVDLLNKANIEYTPQYY